MMLGDLPVRLPIVGPNLGLICRNNIIIMLCCYSKVITKLHS